VLELGCGRGDDTEVLAGVGCQVVAIDLSSRAIVEAKARVPGAEYYCRDIRDAWPSPATQLGVVVASLSLHYFAWDETCVLVDRIRNVLRPGGVLLCRLNSTNDKNHGASGHPRIAENYYSVNGRHKRFFSGENIAALFSKGWLTLSESEMVIHRYPDPKSVWEIIVERMP
jgi:SAM-dependent methyltransferase